MPKFMFLNHGGSPPGDEQGRGRFMEAMQAWMGGLGESIVDHGAPLGTPQSIGGEAGDPPNGYMIVEAADADAAREIAEASPMTSMGGSRLDVHELGSH